MTIPVVEERAEVGTRTVETGRVQVTRRVEVEEAHVAVPLAEEAVEVEHVTIDRLLAPGEPPPAVRTEGDVTIVPVLEEVLVVEKRIRLKEEVRLHKRVDRRTETRDVPVRRERVEIQRRRTRRPRPTHDNP